MSAVASKNALLCVSMAAKGMLISRFSIIRMFFFVKSP
jgi:hypothetical protein